MNKYEINMQYAFGLWFWSVSLVEDQCGANVLADSGKGYDDASYAAKDAEDFIKDHMEKNAA